MKKYAIIHGHVSASEEKAAAKGDTSAEMETDEGEGILTAQEPKVSVRYRAEEKETAFHFRRTKKTIQKKLG